MLTICPATYHAEDIGAILDRNDSTCWLKANDVLPTLVGELRLRGLLKRGALVENVGRSSERVFLDLQEALDVHLSYFSIVLVL
jgi:precorrin-2 methylase